MIYPVGMTDLWPYFSWMIDPNCVYLCWILGTKICFTKPFKIMCVPSFRCTFTLYSGFCTVCRNMKFHTLISQDWLKQFSLASHTWWASLKFILTINYKITELHSCENHIYFFLSMVWYASLLGCYHVSWFLWLCLLWSWFYRAHKTIYIFLCSSIKTALLFYWLLQ